jgi:hypothetical protein
MGRVMQEACILCASSRRQQHHSSSDYFGLVSMSQAAYTIHLLPAKLAVPFYVLLTHRTPLLSCCPATPRRLCRVQRGQGRPRHR